MEKEQIRDLMSDNLRTSFDLFKEHHIVRVHIPNNNICIAYRTNKKLAN